MNFENDIEIWTADDNVHIACGHSWYSFHKSKLHEVTVFIEHDDSEEKDGSGESQVYFDTSVCRFFLTVSKEESLRLKAFLEGFGISDIK